LKRAIEPHIELILIALHQLDDYIPATRQEFIDSRVLQDAILLQLFQVGENLARIRDLRPELFEAAPESWNRIIGLRNLVAHEYRRVDPNRIWRYLEHDLAEFRQTIEALKT
jgi:uncharacterized protein with HEPN domain